MVVVVVVVGWLCCKFGLILKKTLSPDLGQVLQLEGLKCEQNQIVSLPFELSSCKNLKTLNISSNKVRVRHIHAIHAPIDTMNTKLTHFFFLFFFIKISCLPTFLADLPHLRYL